MYITEKNLQQELKNSVDGTLHLIDKAQAQILQDIAKHIFQIDLQNSIFSQIQFPSLPRNWQFITSKIDWPEKSEKNPNGSLFVDPSVIDNDNAADIAAQCFGSKKFGGFKTGLKSTVNTGAYHESLTFSDILVGLLLEDTANQIGAEIDQRSIKSQNSRIESVSTDILKAIKTYISRSVEAVKPLIEMVGGSTGVRDFSKAILTAGSASENNVIEWLKRKSEISKETSEYRYKQSTKDLNDKNKILKKAMTFVQCLSMSLDTLPSSKDREQFVKDINKLARECTNEDELDEFIRGYSKYDDYKSFQKDLERKHKDIPFKLDIVMKPASEGFLYSFNKSKNLFESLDDDEEDEKKDDRPINYDELYNNLYMQLSSSMNDAIGPRTEWQCFKNVEEQMKQLKEAADKEINAKIDLVCNTNGNKYLSIKYPFKAEGMKSMWSRYSSELQSRMNNRIKQLHGSGGGATSGSADMVEGFLRSTYPQIIAMMITYMCVFSQIINLYKNDMIPGYTLEPVKDMLKKNGALYKKRCDDAMRDWENNED